IGANWLRFIACRRNELDQIFFIALDPLHKHPSKLLTARLVGFAKVGNVFISSPKTLGETHKVSLTFPITQPHKTPPKRARNNATLIKRKKLFCRHPKDALIKDQKNGPHLKVCALQEDLALTH